MTTHLSARGRVIADLRHRISLRELPPGERLPSRAALAVHYGVSHFTIVGALAELSALGYVRTRPRSGVFVELLDGSTLGDTGRQTRAPSKVAESTVAVVGTMPSTVQAEYYRKRSGWTDATVVGVFDALVERRLHPLMLDPNSVDEETIESVASTVGGALVMEGCQPATARDCVAAFGRSGVPVVSGSAATRGMNCDQIRFDFERGGYLVSKWLFDRGRRNLVSIVAGAGSEYWQQERHAGYLRAAHECGIEPLELLRMEPSTIVSSNSLEVRARIAAGYMAEWIHRYPTLNALLLPSDGFATEFTRALRILGLEPNNEIAFAGFDNYWLDMPEEWRADGVGPLVTIDKQNLVFGLEMVRMLDERRRLGPSASIQTRVVEPILVISE